MKYLEQRERRTHGTFDFPFGYYNIKSSHPRYHMVDHWHTEYEIIRINSRRISIHSQRPQAQRQCRAIYLSCLTVRFMAAYRVNATMSAWCLISILLLN